MAHILPIRDFEGGYSVTRDGLIWSHKTKRYLRTHDTGHGTLSVTMMRDGKAYKRSIAVIVGEAFLGERPANYDVRHINGDKQDNRVENLEYVHRSVTVKEAIAKGKCDKNFAMLALTKRKLTYSEACEVRDLYKRTKLSHRKLAKLYGVCSSTIYHILHNNSYRVDYAAPQREPGGDAHED